MRAEPVRQVEARHSAFVTAAYQQSLTPLPPAWITTSMEAPHYDRVISDNPVENDVRKSSDVCASRVPVDYAIPPGVLDHSLEHLLHGIQELVAQARPLPFVPKEDLFKIGRRGRSDNEVHLGRSRICRRT